MDENITPVNLTRTDLIGLSTETKPENQKNGTTFYEVDTGAFFIYYKGTWYEQGVENTNKSENISLEKQEIKEIKEDLEMEK